jgi:hypothetical protein
MQQDGKISRQKHSISILLIPVIASGKLQFGARKRATMHAATKWNLCADPCEVRWYTILSFAAISAFLRYGKAITNQTIYWTYYPAE